jgi:3-oxoacyl-(acyl-carrier-protein) synthase
MESCLQEQQIGNQSWPVSPLVPEAEKEVRELAGHKPYHRLDRTVLMAIAAARYAYQPQVNPDSRVGINIGSSRGATATWEYYHQTYLEHGADKLAPHASPTTTLGNVSSWVMQDLQLQGAGLSHSITCSTAIQALANAEAWLKAGKADAFLAGGTEAPLTPFTLAQAQALGIHSKERPQTGYPSQPLGKADHNAMVLGEGAGAFWLMPRSRDHLLQEPPLAMLEATGFGHEHLQGFAGIDEAGTAFQRAMQMALEQQETGFYVDLVLMHAPGTSKGDRAEQNAVQHVFGERKPMLYSHKWQIGHTYGASAALGIAQALHILNTQQLPEFPYETVTPSIQRKPVRKIMVNAAGFGGNAGSLILSKPA